MDLTWKSALVLALMLVVGWLSIRARRQNFDRFRSVHTRRKMRVPSSELSREEPEDR